MNDDAQEIRRMLDERIEAVCDSLALGWKRKGNTGYLSPKSAKDLGSFTVSLRDGRMPRGCWHRFSQAIGGGSVELVSYLLTGRKDDYKAAFSWAREFLGIARETISDEERRQREERLRAEREEADRRRAAREAAESKRAEERIQTVQEVWTETVPIGGTLGDAYLQARGIPTVSGWPWDPVDTIRFHPGIAHERAPRLGRFPAVVGKVVDAWDQHVGLKLILLDRDAPRKCTVLPPGEDPKPTMGPVSGGAVRIGGDGSGRTGGAEGLESSLAAWFLVGCRYPVWSMLSTSGVAYWEPPIFVTEHTQFPDGDFGVLDKDHDRIAEPPGIAAARKQRDRLASTGIKHLISDMCVHGDALDLLNTLRKYEELQPSPP